MPDLRISIRISIPDTRFFWAFLFQFQKRGSSDHCYFQCTNTLKPLANPIFVLLAFACFWAFLDSLEIRASGLYITDTCFSAHTYFCQMCVLLVTHIWFWPFLFPLQMHAWPFLFPLLMHASGLSYFRY